MKTASVLSSYISDNSLLQIVFLADIS